MFILKKSFDVLGVEYLYPTLGDVFKDEPAYLGANKLFYKVAVRFKETANLSLFAMAEVHL